MIVELSIMDILSLMGSDNAAMRKRLEESSVLKETFNKKETYTTERLRESGLNGYAYVADLLEGKAGIPDAPEVLAEKTIKAGWVRKSLKQEHIAALQELPTYLLVNITLEVNKVLRIK